MNLKNSSGKVFFFFYVSLENYVANLKKLPMHNMVEIEKSSFGGLDWYKRPRKWRYVQMKYSFYLHLVQRPSDCSSD